MTWQIVVLLKVLAGSLLAPLAFKLLGDVTPRERVTRIMLQFGWACAFALIATKILWADPSFSQVSWRIMSVGALMPIGAYFLWRAYSISLSRSAVFMSLMNVVPLVLSAAILGEWTAFLGNAPLLLGVTTAILGLGLHCRDDIIKNRLKEKTAAGSEVRPSFYANAVSFMLIFGVATYLENVWAKAGCRKRRRPTCVALAMWG